MGYRTCYYRTFAVASASRPLLDAYKRCRYYLDAAIALIRPGVTTGEVVSLWPKAQEFGFPDEEAAFALQFGHGVGLTIWEKPIFSRLVSLDHPEEIQEGMVFALETFWPASDGWSAARIEEQLVVTADGCEVITRFPAEDLVIAGKPYYTVGGTLSLERDPQSNLNTTSTPTLGRDLPSCRRLHARDSQTAGVRTGPPAGEEPAAAVGRGHPCGKGAGARSLIRCLTGRNPGSRPAGSQHGGDDALARAPARLPDSSSGSARGVGRRRRSASAVIRKPGGAEPALQRVVVGERLLQR